MVADARPTLLLLLAGVSLLALIACANVANLKLARAAGRAKDAALAIALGAGRGDRWRQELTESLLLAALGCFSGILLALWGVPAIARLAPADLPRLAEIAVDSRLLAYAIPRIARGGASALDSELPESGPNRSTPRIRNSSDGLAGSAAPRPPRRLPGRDVRGAAGRRRTRDPQLSRAHVPRPRVPPRADPHRFRSLRGHRVRRARGAAHSLSTNPRERRRRAWSSESRAHQQPPHRRGHLGHLLPSRRPPATGKWRASHRESKHDHHVVFRDDGRSSSRRSRLHGQGRRARGEGGRREPHSRRALRFDRFHRRTCRSHRPTRKTTTFGRWSESLRTRGNGISARTSGPRSTFLMGRIRSRST